MLFELRDVGVDRGGRAVLDSFDASVPEGSTAIVGPSGVGKSTLLRLLNRLADPDRGEIGFRGRPLNTYEPLALRRQVSLVPQLPALLDGTVESNLRYAAELAGEELGVEATLARAGLDPSFAFTYLISVLIVVSVGGLGSIGGSFAAATLIGISDVAGKYYVPELGAFLIYLVMVVLLMWRPAGLFGRR